MNKKVIFGLFCLSVVIAGAQKPFSFSIHGEINNYSKPYIYLFHKWDNVDYVDSAKVIDNKFTINGKSPESNMYWVATENNINYQPNFIFFVDPGKIKLKLKSDSLPFSEAKGGKTQEDHVEYQQMINTFIARQIQLQNDYNQAQQSGDNDKMNEIGASYQNLNKEYLDGLADFVKKHPKSTVSGWIIYRDLNNPNIPIEFAIDVASSLDEEFLKTKFGKLATERVNQAKGSAVGYVATDFTQNDVNDKPVKLSSFRGKYVLVDFWASWCMPCRMENPNVVAAYTKFKDKGFTVLGVSYDSDRNRWIGAIEKDNLTWTQVSDLKGWGNETAKLFGITGIPSNLLLDKDGKIIAKNLRGQALEDKLAEILK